MGGGGWFILGPLLIGMGNLWGSGENARPARFLGKG